MISASNDFKTAAKAPTKQIKAYITDNDVYPDEITESDDLQSASIRQESSLLRTVMRYGEAVYFGNHDYLSKYINIGVGMILADTSTEYIDYGSFRVTSQEYNKANDTIKIKYFDKMYESLISWDLDPIYDRTYPCTLKELLEAICIRLGWTLKSTTFPNDSTEVTSDPFTSVIKTYRQALDMIAEMAASMIYFDVDNELVVAPVAKDSPLEDLDTSVLETLLVEEKYGEINSVVLSRQPTEDNILEKDDASIAANGLTEIKINNNAIADSDRETWLVELFPALFELEFFPFETTTNGLGYFQIGDRITVTDLNSIAREVVVMGIELRITGGLREKLYCNIPDKNSTNYNTAGIIGQRITNTEIIVDKQNGVIILLNQELDSSIASLTLTTNNIIASVSENTEAIGGLQTSVTTLEQTAEDLTIAVQGIGGSNSLKNSVGLKGDIKEWQILDENEDPVDPDNDGTVDQTTDTVNNTESGSAIKLQEQWIQQTFPTIVGETYTFYCRYKSEDDCDLLITGQTTIVIPEDNDWSVFKYQFVASTATTTLRIDNTAYTSSEILLSDNVIKLGDASGWVQAPNEVYGANFKFDADGLTISDTSNQFIAILDNRSLTVYDNSGGLNKIMLQVDVNSGKVTNFVAQDLLVVQRYENPTASLRMVPVDTGALIVINN